MQKTLLTTKEVSRLLRISPSTIDKYRKRGLFHLSGFRQERSGLIRKRSSDGLKREGFQQFKGRGRRWI